VLVLVEPSVCGSTRASVAVRTATSGETGKPLLGGERCRGFKAGSVHWTTLTECKLVFDIADIDPLNYIQQGDVLTVVLSDDPATVGPYADTQGTSDDSENVVSFDTQVKRIRGNGGIVTRTNDSVADIEQVLDN